MKLPVIDISKQSWKYEIINCLWIHLENQYSTAACLFFFLSLLKIYELCFVQKWNQNLREPMLERDEVWLCSENLITLIFLLCFSF